ncbi:SdpI family protein [Nonomuraea sp. CA-218870]|uniref:SdpI family protein n=1 Tax=Nonomuraea sp. CA-218870 TaxID=3239998 RepID=UPI003D91C8AB
MGPILMSAILTAPVLPLLLIPFHDESGAVDGRNGLAGTRTRETLASREAWDAAHAWARAPMRRPAGAIGGVLVVCAGAALALGLPEGAQPAVVAAQAGLLVGGLLVGGLLVGGLLMGGLTLIGRRADRVAARVERELSGRPG